MVNNINIMSTQNNSSFQRLLKINNEQKVSKEELSQMKEAEKNTTMSNCFLNFIKPCFYLEVNLIEHSGIYV